MLSTQSSEPQTMGKFRIVKGNSYLLFFIILLGVGLAFQIAAVAIIADVVYVKETDPDLRTYNSSIVQFPVLNQPPLPPVLTGNQQTQNPFQVNNNGQSKSANFLNNPFGRPNGQNGQNNNQNFFNNNPNSVSKAPNNNLNPFAPATSNSQNGFNNNQNAFTNAPNNQNPFNNQQNGQNGFNNNNKPNGQNGFNNNQNGVNGNGPASAYVPHIPGIVNQTIVSELSYQAEMRLLGCVASAIMLTAGAIAITIVGIMIFDGVCMRFLAVVSTLGALIFMTVSIALYHMDVRMTPAIWTSLAAASAWSYFFIALLMAGEDKSIYRCVVASDPNMML
ncbi:hypothetical protein Ciccas_006686 [Cichlidogyrus casuarinus]|uniref:Uncharacterized protein n=1 Tax=Cichlidogyrus casuarinus TaxID=1844966 RepID=A0ABD2Q6A4_9PLAT